MTPLDRALAIARRAGFRCQAVEIRQLPASWRGRALALCERQSPRIWLAPALASAPSAVLDAVVLHEVGHVVQRKESRYHGRSFWLACRRLARAAGIPPPLTPQASRTWPYDAIARASGWQPTLPKRPTPWLVVLNICCAVSALVAAARSIAWNIRRRVRREARKLMAAYPGITMAQGIVASIRASDRPWLLRGAA